MTVWRPRNCLLCRQTAAALITTLTRTSPAVAADNGAVVGCRPGFNNNRSDEPGLKACRRNGRLPMSDGSVASSTGTAREMVKCAVGRGEQWKVADHITFVNRRNEGQNCSLIVVIGESVSHYAVSGPVNSRFEIVLKCNRVQRHWQWWRPVSGSLAPRQSPTLAGRLA